MTLQETKEKYFQLFTLVIEEAGRSGGNPELVKVKEMLDVVIINSERRTSIYEDDETPFDIFVLLLVIRVVQVLSGKKSIGREEMRSKVSDLFKEYLFKPTHGFTSKYGLPVIKDIWKELNCTMYEKL